jgi:hypothetical protein
LAAGDAPEKSKKDWISVKHNKKNSSDWQWHSFDGTLAIIVNSPTVVANHDTNNWNRTEN